MHDSLLKTLFTRHFSEPDAAMARLGRHLDDLKLPFEVIGRLREVPHPPESRPPEFLKTPIYYFVPQSSRGTELIGASEGFRREADGYGQNLGCPVRLLRALDAFSTLDDQHQQESREHLTDPAMHLNAVEELLWLTGWRSISKTRRGGNHRDGTNIDWAFTAGITPILLEAKYRSSFWPLVSEPSHFEVEIENLMAGVLKKFPQSPPAGQMMVVGITLPDNLSEQRGIGASIGRFLVVNPQIHVVVLRTFQWMTHIFSVRNDLAVRVSDLLLTQRAWQWPANYFVCYERASRDRRLEGPPPRATNLEYSSVAYRHKAPTRPPNCKNFDRHCYRCHIRSRRADGEPEFELVSP